MRKIAEGDLAKLSWVPADRFKREYELRSGPEVLATLKWQGDEVVGEAADGRWRFRRATSPTHTVTVVNADDGSPVAQVDIDRDWSGYMSGEHVAALRWRPANLRRSEWVFTDDAGQAVLHLFLKSKTLSVHGMIEVSGSLLTDSLTSVLAILAWYLALHVCDPSGALGGGV